LVQPVQQSSSKKVVVVEEALQAVGTSTLIPILQSMLGHLPSVVPHAADTTLRQVLFQYLTQPDNDNDEDPDYTLAAQILGGTRMETIDTDHVYYMDPVARTELHVQTAEAFLADDEVTEADAAVQKAAAAVKDVTTSSTSSTTNNNTTIPPTLVLRYKSVYARVLDANRKFLAAAQRYHDLSQPEHATLVHTSELFQFLRKAIICAILAQSSSSGGTSSTTNTAAASSSGGGSSTTAAAGGGGTTSGATQQRTRVLQKLCDDPRLSQLEELAATSSDDITPAAAAAVTLLRQMTYGQVIPPSPTVTTFAQSLAEHQTAVSADGMTLFQRGLVQHNMMALSRIYQSVYLTDNGDNHNIAKSVLGLPSAQQAQNLAVSMIMEGSLPHGTTLDQVHGLLVFGSSNKTDDMQKNAAMTSFCQQLNHVTQQVSGGRHND
jgi:COP9 signalosome complex subunit 4